jgi:hypothetical protein
MMAKVLWVTEAPTAEKALAAVRETLLTLDLETLHVAASFAGSELGELERAVLDDDADEELLAAYRDRIESGYRIAIEEFIRSLEHRRDVTTLSLGSLTGYLTGGMTHGDSPTEAWDEWDRFFAATDDDGWREDWNPCSEAIWGSLFVSPRADWAVSGDRYVAEVTIETKEPAAEGVPAPMAAA